MGSWSAPIIQSADVAAREDAAASRPTTSCSTPRAASRIAFAIAAPRASSRARSRRGRAGRAGRRRRTSRGRAARAGRRAAGRISRPPSLPRARRARSRRAARRARVRIVPSSSLQRDVAGEAVADDHVGRARRAGRGPRRCRRSRARVAASSACASSVSWLPFSGSSPIESSRTSGSRDVEDLLREDRRPCGRTGAGARAGRRRSRPRRSARTGPSRGRDRRPRSPGRSTPGRRRMCEQAGREHRARVPGRDDRVGVAVADRAARRRRARSPASRAPPRPASRPSRSLSVASTSSSPPRVEAGRAEEDGVDAVARRPRARRRRSRPGARSPPIASTAIRTAHSATGRECGAARPRGPCTCWQVGQTRCGRFGLAAGRADVHARRLDAVLGAALVATGLGGFLLGDCHERLRSVAERRS